MNYQKMLDLFKTEKKLPACFPEVSGVWKKNPSGLARKETWH